MASSDDDDNYHEDAGTTGSRLTHLSQEIGGIGKTTNATKTDSTSTTSSTAAPSAKTTGSRTRRSSRAVTPLTTAQGSTRRASTYASANTLTPRSSYTRSESRYSDYDDYETDDYYYESRDPSPEPAPIRKSKWHPQVGLAPAPDVVNVTSQIDTRNKNYKPPVPRKVEIFNDTEYLKRVKSPKHGRRSKSALGTTTTTQGHYPVSTVSSATSSYSDRTSRRQRSSKGSLNKPTHHQTERSVTPAFSKNGYYNEEKATREKALEARRKHYEQKLNEIHDKSAQDDWATKNARLEKERKELQSEIERLEAEKKEKEYIKSHPTAASKRPVSKNQQHIKYYGSSSTQTIDRMTSAEKKMKEVEEEWIALENEEKRFLLNKKETEHKLEVEEQQFLYELNLVEQARNRVKRLELENTKLLEDTRHKHRTVEQQLTELDKEKMKIQEEKEKLAMEKKLEEERVALENERRQFELEKERKGLEEERKKFEEYKKNFQMELQLEREALERDHFENFSVPRSYTKDDDIPLKIDPFDD